MRYDIYKEIASFEGCRLKAYRCPAGVWTIGYGHTEGVKEGDEITQEQADAWLKEEVDRYIKDVRRLVPSTLPKGCVEALASFSYNVGLGAFTKSTLRSVINANPMDLKAVEREMKKWVYAGKKKLDGLAKRREREWRIYLSEYLSQFTPVEVWDRWVE